MLRTLLSKHILGSSKKLIFKNAPASISSRFYSNGSNIVEQWISELDEAKQKRIKFIRNEVKSGGNSEILFKINLFEMDTIFILDNIKT